MSSPTITRLEAEPEITSPSELARNDAAERTTIAHWLSGVALTVVIGLLCAELIGRFVVFTGKPANSNNPQYDTKYRVAGSLKASDANIVLCGDSLMKEGIFPELVTATVKKSSSNESVRVSNLAVTGGTQVDAVQYLEYLKHRNIKPRLVAFDYEVSNTCLPTMASNLDWGQSHSYLFRGMLSRPHGAKEIGQIAPADYSYILRQRANLKRDICDFFAALPSQKIFEQKAFFDLKNSPEFEVSASGMAPNNQVDYKIDWADEKRKIGFYTPFSPQSAVYKYNPLAYSIIIDYCQKNQLPLLMVWLPHQNKVYEQLYYKAPYDAAWHRQQFEQYAKLPMVSTEFLNVLPEDSIYFHDYRHLNTFGCVKTSELLAAALCQPKYQHVLENRAR